MSSKTHHILNSLFFVILLLWGHVTFIYLFRNSFKIQQLGIFFYSFGLTRLYLRNREVLISYSSSNPIN